MAMSISYKSLFNRCRIEHLHAQHKSSVSLGQVVTTLKVLEMDGMTVPSHLQLSIPIEAPVSGYVWLWPAAKAGSIVRMEEEIFTIMDAQELADMEDSGSKEEMVGRSIARVVDAVSNGSPKTTTKVCTCCGESRSEFVDVAPGTNWTGVLQQFVKVGICGSCMEDYGEAFGLVVPWTDKDWKSEHRRKLALAKSSAVIAQALSEVPGDFTEVLLFGHRRLLGFLQSERDVVETTVSEHADAWANLLQGSMWKVLPIARVALATCLSDLRGQVERTKFACSPPEQLDIDSLPEAIEGIRTNIDALQNLQALLDKRTILEKQMDASRLGDKVVSLQSMHSNLSSPCAKRVSYPLAETLRENAATLLGDSTAVQWDKAFPTTKTQPLAAFAGKILRDQEREIDRSIALATSALSKLNDAIEAVKSATEKGEERKTHVESEIGDLELSQDDLNSRSQEMRSQHGILAGVGGVVGVGAAIALVSLLSANTEVSHLMRIGAPTCALIIACIWVWWHIDRRKKKTLALMSEVANTEATREKLALELADVVDKLDTLATDSANLHMDNTQTRHRTEKDEDPELPAPQSPVATHKSVGGPKSAEVSPIVDSPAGLSGPHYREYHKAFAKGAYDNYQEAIAKDSRYTVALGWFHVNGCLRDYPANMGTCDSTAIAFMSEMHKWYLQAGELVQSKALFNVLMSELADHGDEMRGWSRALETLRQKAGESPSFMALEPAQDDVARTLRVLNTEIERFEHQ